MPDFKYQRETHRFFCLGLDVNRPVDAVKQLHFPLLKNVRTFEIGRVEPRPGLRVIAAVDSSVSVHSVRRLNAPRSSTWTRVIGAGGVLSTGQASFTQRDLGYSGNPLAMVPFRPSQSPDPWMYCMDSSRQRKVDVSGNVHQVGLPPPTAVPTVTRQQPRYKYAFAQPNNTTSWTNGPSFVASGMGTVVRTNTTITAILYDSGTTGWCTVYPASIVDITESEDVQINDGGGTDETVFVEQAFAGNAGSTTISDVQFFAGGTDGLCSIVLAEFLGGIQSGIMMENTSDSSYARVESINVGPDESYCVRLTTPSGSTWVAGDTVFARPSFRSYTTNNHAAGETLKNTSLQIGITYTADPALPYTGFMQSPLQTPALDFSEIATGVDTKPDDLISVSMSFTSVKDISSMRLMLGCYNTGTPADAFTQSHYYFDFTPADMVSIFDQTGPLIRDELAETTLSQGRREAVRLGGVGGSAFTRVFGGLLQELSERTGSPSNQAYLNELNRQLAEGEIDQATYNQYYAAAINQARGNAWKSITFPVASLVSVGYPDLQNIYYIRMEITLNPPSEGNKSPGSTVNFGSICVHGGFGPNVGIGELYLYRYRARCSSTGVASNWGPATREPLYLRRQQVALAAPTQYITALEADYIDFQRSGGPAPDWRYVGTIENTSPPSTFFDKYPNDVVLDSPADNQIKYQPWPVLGAPATGTATTVCGTYVASSGEFSTTWAPQTLIEVKGVLYTIYRVIDANTLELFECADTATSVTWRIPEPILLAQTLPCFWGPLAETLFACGDTVNPQRLYWTNPGTADTTSLRNWIDVTNPSEPLQNGVIYNGRSYVWSTERMFQVLPAATDAVGTVVSWNVVEIPNSTGLFGRWAITGTQGQTGPTIAYLGKDGIYETDGGTPRPLTEETLRPLFPNEGRQGFYGPAGGVQPPIIDSTLGATLRLSRSHGLTYFTYRPQP